MSPINATSSSSLHARARGRILTRCSPCRGPTPAGITIASDRIVEVSGTEASINRHIRPRRDEQTAVAPMIVIDQPKNGHGQSVFGPETRMTQRACNGIRSATTSQPEIVLSQDPGVEDPHNTVKSEGGPRSRSPPRHSPPRVRESKRMYQLKFIPAAHRQVLEHMLVNPHQVHPAVQRQALDHLLKFSPLSKCTTEVR